MSGACQSVGNFGLNTRRAVINGIRVQMTCCICIHSIHNFLCYLFGSPVNDDDESTKIKLIKTLHNANISSRFLPQNYRVNCSRKNMNISLGNVVIILNYATKCLLWVSWNTTKKLSTTRLLQAPLLSVLCLEPVTSSGDRWNNAYMGSIIVRMGRWVPHDKPISF